MTFIFYLRSKPLSKQTLNYTEIYLRHYFFNVKQINGDNHDQHPISKPELLLLK